MTHSMRGHRRGSPWRWPLGLGLPLIMLTGCTASDLPSIPTHTPVASPAAVAANELFSVLDSPQEPRDTYVPSAAPFAVHLDASSARWLFDHGETRGWIVAGDEGADEEWAICLALQRLDSPGVGSVACTEPAQIVDQGYLWFEAKLGEGAENLSLYLVADGDEFAGGGQSLSDRAQVFIAPGPEEARNDDGEP